jgi:hypothetical protein
LLVTGSSILGAADRHAIRFRCVRMETGGSGVLRLACRYCGAALVTLGERLTDDALAMLRDHVRGVHPDLALPADAQAGAI